MGRHVGIAKEVTFNTALAPSDFIEAISEDIKQERETEQLAPLRQLFVSKVVELTKIYRGTVETIANYEDVGPWLKAFFGTATTSGAGPYTHTFPDPTPGITDRAESWCFEVLRDTGLNWRYAGGKVISFGVSAATDRAARFTFGCVAASETTPASAAPSFPAFEPIIPSHISVQFDATNLDARTAELSMEWPVDEPFQLGSTEIQREQKDNTLAIAGSVEVYFLDVTEYTKFTNFTDVDFGLIMTDATLSLTINLDTVKLKQATPAVQERERLVATYEFEAFGEPEVILINNDVTLP
jgi:hypothetical protein